MSEEAGFQKWLMDLIGEEGHASDIESGLTAAGFPDVDACVDGFGFQIEAKHYKATKPIHCNAPEIRGTQVMWMRHRVKAGGNPVFLTKGLVKDLNNEKVEVIMMHHGKYAKELASCRSCAKMLDDVPCVYWFELPSLGQLIKKIKDISA